jgi:hypothetical protein
MADVYFKISADINDAIKRIAFFADESSRRLQSVEESFKRVHDVAASVPIAGAVLKIKEAFTSVIDKSAEAEKSFESMRQALRSAGDYSDDAARSFASFAEGIQEISTLDDDAVLQQVALAKSFGATNDEAMKLIRAAVELSAATGGSLSGAVEQLGKTLDGTSGKLAESLPALRKFSAAQLQAGAAIDFVENRFRGSAHAMTETYSGAVAQATNAIDNMLESYGDLITKNGLVIGLLHSITSAVNDGGMRSLVTGLAGAAAGLSAVIAGLGSLTVVFTAASAAAAVFKTTISAAFGPIGVATAALTALGGALGYLLPLLSASATTKKNELAELSGEYTKLAARARQYEEMVAAANRQGIKSDFAKNQNAELEKTNERLEEVRNRIKELTTKEKKNPRFSPELESQIKAIEEKIKNAGMDAGQVLTKEYTEALAKLRDGLKRGQVTDTQYANDTYKLKVKYEHDLGELKAKKLEEEKRKTEKALADQKQRIKDLFDSPFKIFFEKVASIGDVIASSMGAVNLILSSGSTATRDAKNSHAESMDSIKEELAKSNSEIESEYAKSRADIEAQVQAGTLTQVAANEQLAKLQTDYNKRRSDAQIKFQEDSIKAEKDYQKALKEARKSEIAGAAKVMGNALSSVAEYFAPGFGQIVGPIFEQLAKGPDEVREMIQSIIRGIPDVVENVILAIPEVIQSLADGMPEIIDRLADKMPAIIDKLVQRAPDIAIAIARSIYVSVPAALGKAALSFTEKILDGAGQFIQKLIDGIGGAINRIGGGLGSVGSTVTGAIGGLISPIGGSAGSFLGAVSGATGGGGKGSVENAIGVDIPGVAFKSGSVAQAKALSGDGDGGGELLARLDQLISLLGAQSEEPVVLKLMIGERELASQIYNLNRRGYRLA